MVARIKAAERLGARFAGLLLGAGAFVLLAPLPASGQEREGLRGGLSGYERRNEARPRNVDADESDRQPDFRSTYITYSPGALPDNEERDAGDSLFGGREVEADAPASAPLPLARPVDTAAAPEPASVEEVETTGTVRADPIERIARVEPINQRVEAIQGGDFLREQDPYAPLGLRLGTFIVMPSLEQGLTWTSNASSGPGGSPAVLSETRLRLEAVSDWSRHSAAISGYGIFRKSISGEDVSDVEGGVEGDLVLDLAGDFRATASAGYDISPESAASPVDLPPVTSRPLRQALSGSVGVEKDIGRLGLGLTGNVEREQFGDAELLGGGTLSQRERDFVLTTAVLRAGYEISPALTPFVEAEVGRREYDLALDSDGYDRSAIRTALRGGLAMDLGEKFYGEVSAGWVREDFDDARLAPLSAATVAADLFWSPIRGTLVGLQAATTVEGATTPGESGSVLYTGRLSVERRMRANLTGYAALGAEWRDYAGDGERYDLMLAVEAGATFWFNRYAGLVGRARHERVKSSDASSESETSSVFVGVKLQR